VRKEGSEPETLLPQAIRVVGQHQLGLGKGGREVQRSGPVAGGGDAGPCIAAANTCSGFCNAHGKLHVKLQPVGAGAYEIR
jgi:hypothetical protein